MSVAMKDFTVDILLEMLTEAQRELETEREKVISLERKLAEPPTPTGKLRAFKVTVTERDSNERVKAVSIST